MMHCHPLTTAISSASAFGCGNTFSIRQTSTIRLDMVPPAKFWVAGLPAGGYPKDAPGESQVHGRANQMAAWKRNLTPQPPSLKGKGEEETKCLPSPLRGGVGGGVA